MKLNKGEENEIEWEKLCGDILSVHFVDHVKRFAYCSLSEIFGIVGSQRLIEYDFVGMDNSHRQLKKDEIFS
jgi:hypothetical protein